MTGTRTPVRRALVSVYDKTGLAELGQGLAAAGVEIVSTGSTAARLREAGVPVTPVDELTGFPECLDGRVKTLHPAVHAGILADLRLPDHVQQLADLGIAPFELVVVNLYPFAETVASGASVDECVEQIDIGGPTMVRAAAKNAPSVAVVVDPSSYADVSAAVQDGGTTVEQRRLLAVARSGTRRRTTSPSPAGWAPSTPTGRASRPGSVPPGTAPTCCGTARTRTRPRLSTPASARAGLGAAAARQADVLQQLRRR
jgi:hypothetical protein